MMNQDEDSITADELNHVITSLARGDAVDWNEIPLQPSNHFFILGVAPNAARLAVRFFITDSFGNVAQHVQAHNERLRITHAPFEKDLIPLWRLLRATANQKSKDKEPIPALPGDMLRAIMTDTTYPSTLYSQTQIRIRAEHEITYERAAIIKAYLLKNMSTENQKEGLTVELNEKTEYPAYVLGRLFATLEYIQKRAAGGEINTTIKDRYFNSACATPAIVFPQLLKLSQAHLKKIGGGEAYNRNK